MGSVIVGSGAALPELVVTNDDLSRIMDTTDEWIRARCGVEERRFAAPGVGSSDLGAEAVTRALDAAGVTSDEVDALITATMTPDRYAPGIAGAVQRKAGLRDIGVYDLRAQCAGFLYGLDMADMMIRSGRAETVVVVGAEVHAGYLPWGDSWNVLLGVEDAEVTPSQWDVNTETRGWSILFGDGAAALVLRAGPEDAGILAATTHTDGSQDELIVVPGLGFTRRPFADAAQLAAGLHLPQMDGAGLFRAATRLMPEAVEKVLRSIDRKVGDLDLLLAHQANSRIVEAVGKRLGIEPEKTPLNLDRYGNTTAATLPLLYHECAESGRITGDTLLAFAAFGAGAHWGAIAYRHPD